jgi:chitin synthase
MANIMDLLMDYKLTIKVNDSISFPYIVYQVCIYALVHPFSVGKVG